MVLPETHKVVRLHPSEHVIKVESLPTPKIEHPDDAIVKVYLAGLCGSDLHAYRGHEHINNTIVTGHEFVGEVVALGESYSPDAKNRPPLYSTLQIGDKVVSPFTSSCGECDFCRTGFTCRCVHQLLFGSEALPGAQAQYVRVPRAGGTLFVVSPASDVSPASTNETTSQLATLADTPLLLLADILPTGTFAALQALTHPNVLPILKGERFPLSSLGQLGAMVPGETAEISSLGGQAEVSARLRALLSDPSWPDMNDTDRILTIAIIGLGPVGVCATVALLDFLSAFRAPFRLACIDLSETRRLHMQAILNILPPTARAAELGSVDVVPAGDAERWAKENGNLGCHAVLEIVGNNSALEVAYPLLRPFGALISAGVHQAPPVPFTGRMLYNKNVGASFGRCPVRAVFSLAADLLNRRMDVFNVGAGAEAGAGVERVISLDDAPEAYRRFSNGEWGKVAFNPWS